MDPSTWDGAAITMGNSIQTWKQSYAPTLKNRSVQGVVDGYSNFTSQVSGSGGGGDVIGRPHTKPRISSVMASPTNSILASDPSPATQRINKHMSMPFMCLPQPEIGEVNAILVDDKRTGVKRKGGSRQLGRNFDWGGEWGGW